MTCYTCFFFFFFWLVLKGFHSGCGSSIWSYLTRTSSSPASATCVLPLIVSINLIIYLFFVYGKFLNKMRR